MYVERVMRTTKRCHRQYSVIVNLASNQNPRFTRTEQPAEDGDAVDAGTTSGDRAGGGGEGGGGRGRVNGDGTRTDCDVVI